MNTLRTLIALIAVIVYMTSCGIGSHVKEAMNDEGETPYDHKGHPYVFMAYPFINGEIYSVITDCARSTAIGM